MHVLCGIITYAYVIIHKQYCIRINTNTIHVYIILKHSHCNAVYKLVHKLHIDINYIGNQSSVQLFKYTHIIIIIIIIRRPACDVLLQRKLAQTYRRCPKL